jgi:hypothetical protein
VIAPRFGVKGAEVQTPPTATGSSSPHSVESAPVAASQSRSQARAEPPASKRPPADRTPSRPGEAEKITFDDLNLKMQADMVFRPFLLTERVKELDGKRISIMGYIHPGATGKGIKEFVLLRNTECKFGAGGQADHLAQVFMRQGNSVDFQLQAVRVEALLKIEPFEGPDGNTWSIYRLEDAIRR